VYSEKTPDDGQRNFPKHVEFYSKNKFEKLVHLAGLIVRGVCVISKLARHFLFSGITAGECTGAITLRIL
jgi:hypothetical protein